MVAAIPLIVASTTQTGDMAHIAGALALYPTTNALILHAADRDPALFRALYQKAASLPPVVQVDRLQFLPIPPSQVNEPEKTLYNTLKFCSNLHEPTEEQTETFRSILGDVAYAQFTNKYCVPVSEVDSSSKFVVINLSEVTKAIAKAFRKDRIGSYRRIAEAFIFDRAQLPIANIISQDGRFGNVTLPARDKTVLLVWARYTGTKTDTGFNPEGDSDPTGQNQIVEVATELGFSVVTIGDVPPPGMTNVVNNARCQLGEFWTQAPLAGRGRAAQCSFFAALMQRYPGRLYQIGQKTGAMDFPALLGVPTIYIEDSQISQQARSRMQKWAHGDNVQLYRRLMVEDPPSLVGKGSRRLSGIFDDEKDAGIARESVGEATWRMAGLTLCVKDRWTEITGFPEEEGESFNDVVDLINKARPEELQTWKDKINALSDDILREEKSIRGYTEKDRTNIKTELERLRNDYSGPASIGRIIIRLADGTYAIRAQ